MSGTINLRAVHISQGGARVTVTASLDGVAQITVVADEHKVNGTLTEDDIQKFVFMLLRIAKRGRTYTQVKNALLQVDGVDVVIP